MTESEAINLIRLDMCDKCLENCIRTNKCPFSLAIKALEKQIPKKVNTPPCNTCEKELCDCECKHFAVSYRDNYRCPTCNSNRVYISEYEFRHDYCPNCGQKLDWSEEE